MMVMKVAVHHRDAEDTEDARRLESLYASSVLSVVNCHPL
jgi:hypothetical protein